MSDTPSIRDAYWAETLAKRRSWAARSIRVVQWFVAIPFIALPVVRTAMIGWQGVLFLLLIALIVAGVAWIAAAPARRDKKRLEELREQGFRECGCGYDLRGLPDNGKCPECAADYTEHTFRERWASHVRNQWFPIGERRMWRALTWWQLALLALVPVVFVIAYIRPSRGDLLNSALVAVLLAAIIGLILYITRGQDFEWRALTRRNFRTCPCCLRSLATLPESGECPRCRTAYTSDQLRSTWSVIYRRQLEASHSAP